MKSDLSRREAEDILNDVQVMYKDGAGDIVVEGIVVNEHISKYTGLPDSERVINVKYFPFGGEGAE